MNTHLRKSDFIIKPSRTIPCLRRGSGSGFLLYFGKGGWSRPQISASKFEYSDESDSSIYGSDASNNSINITIRNSQDVAKLNTYQAVAALVRIAKLSLSKEQSHKLEKYKLLVDLLADRLHEIAWDLDARGVCNVLWAMGKLRNRNDSILTELLSVAAAKSLDMDATSLSMTLYGLAVIETQYSSTGSRHTVRGTANASLAPQKRASGRLFTASALQPLLDATGPKLYMFGHKALSNTSWALAKLRCRPSAGWLRAFTTYSGPLLHQMPPQELSNVLWALVRFGASPPPAWIDSLLDASFKSLDNFSYRDIGNITWGVANLGVKPPTYWVEAICKAAARPDVAISADGSAVAGLMYALSRWRARPPKEFIESLFDCAASEKSLQRFTALQCCDLLRALSNMRISPSQAWSEVLLERLKAAQNQPGEGSILGPGLRLEIKNVIKKMGLGATKELV